ncbi:uncharacterized protein [Dermacentor andersoni]|uniref:uncharacterized protein isoform X1 n=1 Tax=Dermacentor andersoni TaxID=34620 RepID=UPI003B3A969B
MESEYESDPFAVVSFPEEEDSLAIIHTSWLKGDHRSTFWPIEKNPGKRRKLTMQGTKPTDSWIEVQCVVKRWADTYERAQNKLNSLQYSSDSNSGRELGRGKRRRRRAMHFREDEENGSSDYDENDEYVQPRAPTPPQPLSVTGRYEPTSGELSYQLPHCTGNLPEATQMLYSNHSFTSDVRDCSFSLMEASQPSSQANALHRSVATHAEAPRLYTDLQTQGSAYRPVSTSLAETTRPCTNPHVLDALHRSEAAGSFTELQTRGSSYTPVSTPLAGATRSRTEPHVLGALCRPASTHAEAASFTELQPLDSSYRPVSTYLTGATRSHTDPQVLAFMERVLQVLNGIKQTQQAHSQCLNELLSNANSASSQPCDLPDLPFLDATDVLDYDKKLETDRQAQHQMKKHLAVQGGDSTKQKTTRILQSLLSRNAAISFSWFGTKGKKKFSELNLCKLMCGTLTNDIRHPDATLKDVERAAMTWFRHAAERLAAQQI